LEKLRSNQYNIKFLNSCYRFMSFIHLCLRFLFSFFASLHRIIVCSIRVSFSIHVRECDPSFCYLLLVEIYYKYPTNTNIILSHIILRIYIYFDTILCTFFLHVFMHIFVVFLFLGHREKNFQNANLYIPLLLEIEIWKFKVISALS